MSLTIDTPVSASAIATMSPDQAARLYQSLSSERSTLYRLERMLRNNPHRAVINPRTRHLLERLLKHSGPQGLKQGIATMRRELTGLMHSLKARMSPPATLPAAAAERYGSAVGSEIDKIMKDPSLSLEEKFMMLATTLAAKMESEIEAKMNEWATLTSGSQGSGSGSGSGLGSLVQAGAGLLGNMMVPVIGGQIASQVAGQALGGGGQSGDDKTMKSKQLETQIQLLMQRLNRMTTMISTLMQDEHKTKSAVIANMRV